MDFPKNERATIARREGLVSDHAFPDVDRLGLVWDDILQVVTSAESWRRERDPRQPRTYKYVVIGRDAHGRRLYMVGKVVQCEGERLWKVITIHEAD